MRWCTRAPLSPKPSRTSGATSSSGNERSMSTSTGRRRQRGRARARHPRCGRLSGRSPRRGGKGSWPSGPTHSKPKGKGGKGKSPNTSSTPWPDHWVTRAYIQWANALHHSLIKFDECRLGQVVVKSTTLSTDLPLHHWHDLRCNHGAHPRGEKLNSSDLSRYPEQMMQGLAAAILCRAGPVLEALKPGGTVHQANPTTRTLGDNKRR